MKKITKKIIYLVSSFLISIFMSFFGLRFALNILQDFNISTDLPKIQVTSEADDSSVPNSYESSSSEGKKSDSSFSFRKSYLTTQPSRVSLNSLIGLSLVISVFILLKVMKSYDMHHSLEDLEGEERWATTKELKQNFTKVPLKNIESAEHSGTLVASKYGYYYIDKAVTHNLIIGTTGSGKTQSHVLQAMRVLFSSHDKQNAIVNDPKGEIFKNTYQIAHDNGYEVVVLNLRDTSLSSQWNPLSFVINEYVYCIENNLDLSKVSEYITTMSETLTYNPKSDPVWPASAQSLLEAMILYMIEAGYGNGCLDTVNFYSIYQFFVEYGGRDEQTVDQNGMAANVNMLDKLFQNLPVGSLAKAAYATSKFAAGEMRSSIFATLSQNIKLFGTDTGIAQLTAGNDIDIDSLIKNDKPFVVYMIVPDDRPSRHVLASMFINQCYLSMVEYLYKNDLEALPRRVNFILDEFANMVHIPGMDNKITVSRSRNIQWWLYIQGLPQLDAKYEKDAKTIRENCANLIYIYSGDPDTNKYISDTLGSSTREYKTYSGKLSDALSENQQYKGKPLKSVSQLRRLKYGETICIRHRMYPVISTFGFFYKLGIKTTKLSDVIADTRSKKLSDSLFPLEIFEEHLKSIDNPELDTESRTAIPHTLIESPDAHVRKQNEQNITPMKLAINGADENSDGRFSAALDEGDFKKCKAIIRKFKMTNRMPMQAIELLDSYVEQQEKNR